MWLKSLPTPYKRKLGKVASPYSTSLTLDALDLDRHCGVIIAPSGAPCMRSLTCKSHSATSKRAVIGRTRDFDSLLAEYLVNNPSKATGNDRHVIQV